MWKVGTLMALLAAGGEGIMAQDKRDIGMTAGTDAIGRGNHLATAISPYLQQHAGNPVHWYPWGEEAFALARQEDKPIFLSVGYSTCHWCHVMNRESFEHPVIAGILNRHFVAIKVDREERPDVDRMYMTFVTATTGSGGWPLSVWLTPDLQPFAGGTYYPPEDRWGRPGFRSVLMQIAQAWQTDREGIMAAGQQVVEQMRQAARAKYQTELALDDALLQRAYAQIRAGYDAQWGGFSGAPKFPRPSVPQFLLRYHARTGEPLAREMTLHTLRRMALGGIYDQVGGGFHRYAVDARWHVPHFEKMLYDQALLVPVYLEAYQLTGDTFFADVARDILAYVARDLTGPSGQFFSAEDADSPLADQPGAHAEGAFYVWTAKELAATVGPDNAAWVLPYFGVETNGNVLNDPHQEFAGRNILYVAGSWEDLAGEKGLAHEEMSVRLSAIRAQLLAVRSERPRPHRDDKAITAWNAMMISAYARAYQVLEDPAYLAAAERALAFIRTRLYDPPTGTLHRLHRGEAVSGDGYLEDYAFLIQALLDLYECTFDTRHLVWAMALQAQQEALFADPDGGGYFDTAADDARILLRMKDDHDGAAPAGNSISAMNLLRLAEMTSREDYRNAAIGTCRAFARHLMQIPQALPAMVGAVDFLRDKPRQILIAGQAGADDTAALLRVVRRAYLPNRIVMLTDCSGGAEVGRIQPFLETLTALDGQATAYVCEDHVCALPVQTPEALAGVLRVLTE